MPPRIIVYSAIFLLVAVVIVGAVILDVSGLFENPPAEITSINQEEAEVTHEEQDPPNIVQGDPITPTPTATPTHTPSLTPTATSTSTVTDTPSPTTTATETPYPTLTPTLTATPTAVPNPLPPAPPLPNGYTCDLTRQNIEQPIDLSVYDEDQEFVYLRGSVTWPPSGDGIGFEKYQIFYIDPANQKHELVGIKTPVINGPLHKQEIEGLVSNPDEAGWFIFGVLGIRTDSNYFPLGTNNQGCFVRVYLPLPR